MIETRSATAVPLPPLEVAVTASPASELLIGLWALTASDPRPDEGSWVPLLPSCSLQLQRRVDEIGAESGELWLHLLGFALELSADSATDFLGRLGEVDALELRRHLVGVNVPAWRTAVGRDALERAAAGDADAAAAILSDSCYYGGQARNALARILPLSAAQTKKRVLAVLRQFIVEVFAQREDELMSQLRDEAAVSQALVGAGRPEEVIASITSGYVYEREPEIDAVVLIPHLAASPWRLLCQHNTQRIIGYPLNKDARDPLAELHRQALQFGRVLGDEKRIEIVARLARGEATLSELVVETGLVKSTVHHHLAQIRAAGLITVRGGSGGNTYALSDEGLARAREALDTLFGDPPR